MTMLGALCPNSVAQTSSFPLMWQSSPANTDDFVKVLGVLSHSLPRFMIPSRVLVSRLRPETRRRLAWMNLSGFILDVIVHSFLELKLAQFPLDHLPFCLVASTVLMSPIARFIT